MPTNPLVPAPPLPFTTTDDTTAHPSQVTVLSLDGSIAVGASTGDSWGQRQYTEGYVPAAQVPALAAAALAAAGLDTHRVVNLRGAPPVVERKWPGSDDPHSRAWATGARRVTDATSTAGILDDVRFKLAVLEARAGEAADPAAVAARLQAHADRIPDSEPVLVDKTDLAVLLAAARATR